MAVTLKSKNMCCHTYTNTSTCRYTHIYTLYHTFFLIFDWDIQSEWETIMLAWAMLNFYCFYVLPQNSWNSKKRTEVGSRLKNQIYLWVYIHINVCSNLVTYSRMDADWVRLNYERQWKNLFTSSTKSLIKCAFAFFISTQVHKSNYLIRLVITSQYYCKSFSRFVFISFFLANVIRVIAFYRNRTTRTSIFVLICVAARKTFVI